MKDLKLHIVAETPANTAGIKWAVRRNKNIHVSDGSFNGDVCKYISETLPDILFIEDLSNDKLKIEDLVSKISPGIMHGSIIIFSNSTDAEYFEKLIFSGVKGIISSRSSCSDVLKAVTAVAGGINYFDSIILEAVLNRKYIFSRQDEINIQQLTKRELLLLYYISLGYKNKKIADQLCLAPHTIEVEKDLLVKKFHLKSCNDLLIFAVTNQKKIVASLNPDSIKQIIKPGD